MNTIRAPTKKKQANSVVIYKHRKAMRKKHVLPRIRAEPKKNNQSAIEIFLRNSINQKKYT